MLERHNERGGLGLCSFHIWCKSFQRTAIEDTSFRVDPFFCLGLWSPATVHVPNSVFRNEKVRKCVIEIIEGRLEYAAK